MINKFAIILVCISLVFVSCKSEYTNAVEKELASGVINDSLIFGMKMGQTRKDFYRICWDLNKAKLIGEGTGNMTARYIEPYDSTMDVTLRKEMLFYAIFDSQDTMRGMDMTYNYTAYAPWILKTGSDSLVMDLKSIYKKKYLGNDFLEINLDLDKYKAYSKIDGNRQILIYPKNEREAVVKMEDLRYTLKKHK